MNETHPSTDQIVDYLHGELPSGQDAAMHVHLAGCRSCDDRRAEELALTETLRAHARAEERDLPASVAARIYAAIELPRPFAAWERLRAGLRPIFVLPAVAAIAVILYFGFGARSGSTAPTPIDAAYFVDQHAALTASAPFGNEAPPTMLSSDDEAR
jgi:anti-sigma factor RsiW